MNREYQSQEKKYLENNNAQMHTREITKTQTPTLEHRYVFRFTGGNDVHWVYPNEDIDSTHALWCVVSVWIPFHVDSDVRIYPSYTISVEFGMEASRKGTFSEAIREIQIRIRRF